MANPEHSNYNLNYKNSLLIPIVFHNLFSGFIIKDANNDAL